MLEWREDPAVPGLPFTDAARRLLADARSESERLRHEYVGTEHLVLALTRQSDEAALLLRMGLDGDQVRRLMEQAIIRGRVATVRAAELPYTSRTKKTFSIASESARAAGSPCIEVEHILLGMFREGRNIGAEVLQQCGLTVEQVAAQLHRVDAEDEAG